MDTGDQTPFDKAEQRLRIAFRRITKKSYSYFIVDDVSFDGLDEKQADQLREYCYKKYNIPKGTIFYIVAVENNEIFDDDIFPNNKFRNGWNNIVNDPALNDAVMGVWISENGTRFVDPSCVVRTREEAFRLGNLHGQDAVTRVPSDGIINIIPIPKNFQ